MTPARRRKIIGLRKRSKNRNFFKPFFALLVLAALGFFAFNTKLWRAERKVGVVINSPVGDIVVVVLDAKNEEMTKIIIPGSTELEVARQLGKWKARSVWKLGENEKLGGKLLRETIIKDFHFPILGFADGGAYGFSQGDALGILKAAILPYKSNLTVADRIRIGLFSLGVKASKRRDIDLTRSSYLKKARLKDGEEGYLISGKIPKELLIVFSEPEIASEGLKVNIKDATGNGFSASEVGETIEVLGAKVTAVTKLPRTDSDCQVAGKVESSAKSVGELFGCKMKSGAPDGNFDIELEIGEAFARRF